MENSWIKLFALGMVAGVAKALFSPPRAASTFNTVVQETKPEPIDEKADV